MERQLTAADKFWGKIGVPSHLVWGYIGVIIFMVGDGLEQGWLSPYLLERGMSTSQVALLFTVYGVASALSAWVSGVAVQVWGGRKTMVAGLILFTLGAIPFIAVAIPDLHFSLMIPTYMLRGLGYPLFAYSFIVWISYRTDGKMLGRAVGWFWFVFTCGLNVIGPFYSSLMIPVIGHIHVLWSGLIFVWIGAAVSLLLNRDKFIIPSTSQSKLKEMADGFTFMFRHPRIAVATTVKSLQAVGQYGFAIFLPSYLLKYGYSTAEWLQIWGSIFTVNIIFNVVFGIVGDKFGWRNTITWFGAVGSAVATLLMFYMPQIIGHNFPLMLIIYALYGITLAGFVPLTALVPSMAPDDKGAAISALNLGSGLCAFIAPLLVGLLLEPFGTGGVMYVFAALYLVIACLTGFLKTPEELGQPVHKASVDGQAPVEINEATKEVVIES